MRKPFTDEELAAYGKVLRPKIVLCGSFEKALCDHYVLDARCKLMGPSEVVGDRNMATLYQFEHLIESEVLWRKRKAKGKKDQQSIQQQAGAGDEGYAE